MAKVLHLLPHPGGGAERYLELLSGLENVDQERAALASGPEPSAAARTVPLRWPRVAARAARADLLHAHGDVAAALALPLLRARPAVWTTHGLHFLRRATGRPRTVAHCAVRAVVRATARTICTSDAERRELAGLVGPALATRLVTVHNGIDLPAPVAGAERAAARAALNLADGDVAVLFLGELSARKGVLDAVEATLAAAGRGAPVVLLVAGEGPQDAEVRARSGPAVRTLGFRSDVERLLAAADLFVMPSEREGLSFAVLEAMGRGLAMVVSDGAGNPEAVGDAGVVVPAGDRMALAAALERLAGDAAERARLGAAARERVRLSFPRAGVLAGVEAAYAAALTAPGRGAGAVRA
jgi:glycosyltransferase involved in cell wall biosynthesis